MGNVRSSETGTRESDDIWWNNGNASSSSQSNIFESSDTISSEREQRRRELEEDFEKFKQDLATKHERRKQLISEKRKEMADLRTDLLKEREENDRLKKLLKDQNYLVATKEDEEEIRELQKENQHLKTQLEQMKLILGEKDVIVDKNNELRIAIAEMQKELQSVNTQVVDFEKERSDYQQHVIALKDVIKVSKEMLKVRESQMTELKKKISTIEELLASKEVSILSDDLRQEYERQLQNIKDLRILYQERQRSDSREKERLKGQIEDLQRSAGEAEKKTQELEERIAELENDNSQKYDKIVNLESNLGLSKAECRELQAEMTVINQLFSQILISFNNEQDVDLDNLIKTLEENHDLLTNIAINDECNEASALPKVLLDLVNRVNENKRESAEVVAEQKEKAEEDDAQIPALHQLNSPEEIVENLPKVWRVLIELLSHQSVPSNEIAEKKTNENDNHCYKSVETPTGLRKVLSVSKTFIRLKSLILEKKSVEKEMNRLKQLNIHLEGRLQDQEKRLVLVSSELSKTWNVVGVMQKQHHQLHTQEKILRYELAQKRKLLTELKEELEYCRQKWLQAREQNSSTEEQWKQLRTEFASRKQHLIDDINNSVESGYSDDKSSSDDDIPDSDVEKIDETDGEKNNSIKLEGKIPEGILEVVQTEVEQIVNSVDTDSTTELQADDFETEKNSIQQTIKNSQEISSSSLEIPSTNLVEAVEVQQIVNAIETDKPTIELHADDLEKKITSNQQINTNSHEISSTFSEIPPKNLIDAAEVDQIVKPSDTKSTTELHVDNVEIKESSNKLIDKNSQVISFTPSEIAPKNPVEQPGIQQIVNSFETDYPMELQSDNIEIESSSQQLNENSQEIPSTSSEASPKNPIEAAEEFVARREARMKRLEEQCNQLYTSVAKTSLRGFVMCNKLSNLHETYGESSQENTETQNAQNENLNENKTDKVNETNGESS